MQPDELKAIRKSIGMSQGEMAAALGMSVDTVSRMERGMPGYPIETRTALAVQHVQLKALVAADKIRFHSGADDTTAAVLAALGASEQGAAA